MEKPGWGKSFNSVTFKRTHSATIQGTLRGHVLTQEIKGQLHQYCFREMHCESYTQYTQTHRPTSQFLHEGQRTACRSWILLSTLWGLGAEFRSSGLGSKCLYWMNLHANSATLKKKWWKVYSCNSMCYHITKVKLLLFHVLFGTVFEIYFTYYVWSIRQSSHISSA